jgi:hypothetical protein
MGCFKSKNHYLENADLYDDDSSDGREGATIKAYTNRTYHKMTNGSMPLVEERPTNRGKRRTAANKERQITPADSAGDNLTIAPANDLGT